ncbi:MAG TPA: S-adenosylmethionine:tRNA ribosyltransferase-isomerase, partial [Candidatus Methylomirabilis sp.]|nr:S-adenosylmethionine:tRNA ribosyltransferase-isomerase [Candidatus Methylomirabilis sp.]
MPRRVIPVPIFIGMNSSRNPGTTPDAGPRLGFTPVKRGRPDDQWRESPMMRLSDFDYDLPPELIAQEPPADRDASRLLILTRRTGQIEHRRFSDLPVHLRAGDLLVINDTKVIPARLYGVFEDGKSVEILLARPAGNGRWDALVKP